MRDRDQHFRAGDASLRLRDEGSGPPVVFIHGWTLDLECWDPQVPVLAATFRVLRYDRRGFGLSEGTPSRSADVDDLARLLDHLRLESVTVVGHSQGARVALAFALSRPGRVAALVLDGPPDETGGSAAAGDEDFSISEYRTLAAGQGVDAFRRAWHGHPLMRLHSADAATRELAGRLLARYPARDLTGAPDAPPPAAGAEALSRLHRPVLVVNGEFDTPIRLRAGRAIARALPFAERVVIAGAGHLPNLDAPSAYNDALQSFLRRQALAAA
jgi:pimeloyl-ACP methyl ester carboxylesterase